MRRLAFAGVVIASCTIAYTHASAQDAPTPASGAPAAKSTVTWFPWWNGAPDKGPPSNAGPPDKKAQPIKLFESPARMRDREQQTWLRRNDVVLKLREIATQTGDEKLLRKADDLQGRVWDAYKQKLDQIPTEILADGPTSSQGPTNSAKSSKTAAATPAEDKQ